MKVPLPYLLVLNSTTNHHHIPEDEPTQLTPEAITIFLDSIQNQSAKVIFEKYFFGCIRIINNSILLFSLF